ncbi:hypothetical protein D3C80_718610 [compost metagenome]
MANSLARPSLLALTLSAGMLGAVPSFAADEMDHSAMGHGSMKMGRAPSHDSMPGMDHGAMDHSTMNHGSASLRPAAVPRFPN